eukprot:687986-Pleurochrysis_carterae.AAC.1
MPARLTHACAACTPAPARLRLHPSACTPAVPQVTRAAQYLLAARGGLNGRCVPVGPHARHAHAG